MCEGFTLSDELEGNFLIGELEDHWFVNDSFRDPFSEWFDKGFTFWFVNWSHYLIWKLEVHFLIGELEVHFGELGIHSDEWITQLEAHILIDESWSTQVNYLSRDLFSVLWIRNLQR